MAAGARLGRRAPIRSGGGRPIRRIGSFPLAATANVWRSIFLLGNACQFLATTANPWHWIRRTGNDRQSLALTANVWQALPDIGERCQEEKSVAGFLRAPPG
jgi:hypothetical protein